jgi:hypothetical protein
VTDHKSPIDLRPFRSKSDQEREAALQARYHNLAIPEVVAALQIGCDAPANNAIKKPLS